MAEQKDFSEVQELLEEVKKTIDLPTDANGVIKPLTQDEIEAMVNRSQAVIDKLNKRANEIAAQSGMTRDELNHYLENPDNFRQDEWEALQHVNTELDKARSHILQKNLSPETVEAERQKQGRKHLGKRGNWMPL